MSITMGRMIDPSLSLQTHTSLEIRTTVQTHTILEETTCFGFASFMRALCEDVKSARNLDCAGRITSCFGPLVPRPISLRTCESQVRAKRTAAIAWAMARMSDKAIG